MPNYSVVAGKKKFLVKEAKTSYVIRSFTDKQAALRLAKRLNGGFGFAGETPSFFIKKEEQVC